MVASNQLELRTASTSYVLPDKKKGLRKTLKPLDINGGGFRI